MKTVRDGVKPVMRGIGKHWHDRLLGKHFTEKGAREYGYQRRTLEYRVEKRKTMGHSRPLVYTGELEKAVKRAYILASTKKSVKVKMKGPRHLHYNPPQKSGRPINKADELTRVSQKEITAIAKRFRDGVVTRMNNTRKRETRVIR